MTQRTHRLTTIAGFAGLAACGGPGRADGPGAAAAPTRQNPGRVACGNCLKQSDPDEKIQQWIVVAIDAGRGAAWSTLHRTYRAEGGMVHPVRFHRLYEALRVGR